MNQSRAAFMVAMVLFSCAVVAEGEFDVDPGITPDSPFYFIDQLFERVGDDPEKALAYKQEKIAEALAMAEEQKVELAEEVLTKASEYGAVLKKEVTPEMEETVTERSEIIERVLQDLPTKVPELEGEVSIILEQEEKTRLAAKVSSKIKELCESLATLDLIQYQETCKTDGETPQWQKEMDVRIGQELEGEVKAFAETLSQCFASPAACDCSALGVQSLETICTDKKSQLTLCQQGDQNACQAMMLDDFDAEEFLPADLLAVYEDLNDQFRGRMEQRFRKEGVDGFLPPPCVERGATSLEECEKMMFTVYAPQECIEAGASTREECASIYDRIQFEQHAAPECLDAGIETRSECEDFLRESRTSKQYSGQCDDLEEEEELQCLEQYFEVVQAEIVTSGRVIVYEDGQVVADYEGEIVPYSGSQYQESEGVQEIGELPEGYVPPPSEPLPSEVAAPAEEMSGGEVSIPEGESSSTTETGSESSAGESTTTTETGSESSAGEGSLITGNVVREASTVQEANPTTQWFWMENYVGIVG